MRFEAVDCFLCFLGGYPSYAGSNPAPGSKDQLNFLFTERF
jgi:hypothetical protein